MSEIEVYSELYDEKSSTGKLKQKKTTKKSKHKHDYQDILLAPYGDRKFCLIGQQCKLCGKINSVKLLSKSHGNYSTEMTFEEAKEEYNWPIVYNYDWIKGEINGG